MKTGNKNGQHWIADARRLAIYLRDRCLCQWCGETTAQLSLDHLKPRSKGGSNKSENLVTSCLPCNVRRRALPVAVFARVFAGSSNRIGAARRRNADRHLEAARALLAAYGFSEARDRLGK